MKTRWWGVLPRRIGTIGTVLLAAFAAGAVALWPGGARAAEPNPEAPPSEEDPLESARRDAAGTHFAFEVGPAMLYAPALPSFPAPNASMAGDVVLTQANESLVTAGAQIRLGLQVGVSRLLDVRVGAGTWLGGQLVGDVVGPFTALPHLYVGLTVRPHALYFAEVGVAGGPYVFERGPSARLPKNPIGAVFAEIAPLGLAFGGHHAFRLKLTQGLGTMFTGAYDFCATSPPGFVCAATTTPSPSRVYFAGHTMLTFGAVLP